MESVIMFRKWVLHHCQPAILALFRCQYVCLLWLGQWISYLSQVTYHPKACGSCCYRLLPVCLLYTHALYPLLSSNYMKPLLYCNLAIASTLMVCVTRLSKTLPSLPNELDWFLIVVLCVFTIYGNHPHLHVYITCAFLADISWCCSAVLSPVLIDQQPR